MKDNHTEILPYLIELRKRLLHSLIGLIIIFAGLFSFANDLYTWIALPLLRHLPQGQAVIATHVVSPLFVPLELTFVIALFLAFPLFLYQLWAFIAPALYHHERQFVWLLLLLSTLLFYLGLAFAYFIIFPILFGFLTHTAPKGILIMPDISEYLDFVLKLFFMFGAIFEVPVIIVLLVWTGILARKKLIQLRPYAIVGSFILGMLLAPPDVVSQTLFAIPLWLLFESGIFLSQFFAQKDSVDVNEKPR